MNKVAAFFDVDETLINIKSMFDFYQYWCTSLNMKSEYEQYIKDLKNDFDNGKPRETINREYYHRYAGIKYTDLIEAGAEWFKSKIQSALFVEKTVNLLKLHQVDNIVPVFVSGSMLPILLPIANYLNVKDILCTSLQLDSKGLCTGEINFPQTIGIGKQVALLAYCEKHKINPNLCFGYGDDISDVPMLEATGNPVCVGNNSLLIHYAQEHGWNYI